jgi:hypothetical protein
MDLWIYSSEEPFRAEDPMVAPHVSQFASRAFKSSSRNAAASFLPLPHPAASMGRRMERFYQWPSELGLNGHGNTIPVRHEHVCKIVSRHKSPPQQSQSNTVCSWQFAREERLQSAAMILITTGEPHRYDRHWRR